MDFDMLVSELRGWNEREGMSDDARRKIWLMKRAADVISDLRRETGLCPSCGEANGVKSGKIQ